MRTLDKFQRNELQKWFWKQKDCPKTNIYFITLTFDLEARRTLKQKASKSYNPFVGAAKLLMVKVSRKLKAHLFGYIAHESCSISSTSMELVGEHIHFLFAVKFDHLARNLTPSDFSAHWKHSTAEQVVLQAWDRTWDGLTALITYSYGPMIDHYHNVVITDVFHPRNSPSCHDGSCPTCRLFPKPEEILDWENHPPPM